MMVKHFLCTVFRVNELTCVRFHITMCDCVTESGQVVFLKMYQSITWVHTVLSLFCPVFRGCFLLNFTCLSHSCLKESKIYCGLNVLQHAGIQRDRKRKLEKDRKGEKYLCIFIRRKDLLPEAGISRKTFPWTSCSRSSSVVEVMIPQCRKARVKVSMKKHLNQSRLKGTKVDSLVSDKRKEHGHEFRLLSCGKTRHKTKT